MIYEARLKEVWDKNSEVDFAMNRGLQEGEKKKQIQIARNLLKINLELEQISIATGLSIDEISELEKNKENFQ
jgi:predicted transposase/invertase (TIGR01784 family)